MIADHPPRFFLYEPLPRHRSGLCIRQNAAWRRHVSHLLEWNLENAVSQLVPIQVRDRYQCLLVVCHCDKTKALALLCCVVAHHLNVLHSSEWTKQLPKDVLFGLRCQVVNKDAPTIHNIANAVRQLRCNCRINGSVPTEFLSHLVVFTINGFSEQSYIL